MIRSASNGTFQTNWASPIIPNFSNFHKTIIPISSTKELELNITDINSHSKFYGKTLNFVDATEQHLTDTDMVSNPVSHFSTSCVRDNEFKKVNSAFGLKILARLSQVTKYNVFLTMEYNQSLHKNN
jgi:hypothetical protein